MSVLGDARDRVMTLLDDVDTAVGTLATYRFFPGSVDPPAAVVWPENWASPVTLGDAVDVRLRCRLFVQVGEHEDAQDVMDSLVDDVTDALATDDQIGQLVGENYGMTDWGNANYLTADLVFTVLA